MTSLRGNLNSVDLANIFQMLSMNQREGTLYIYGDDGRKAIYFGHDGVSMLARGKSRQDALGRILLRHDWVSEEQLQDALKRQEEGSGRMLGQVLVEQGVVTRQQIEDSLRIQIEEEVYNLFIAEGAQFEFEEGEPAEEFRELAGAKRVTFNVNSLIMEAAQRIDEWEWIRTIVPTGDEIFRYTGKNADLEDPIFQSAAAGKVLGAVDGRLCVNEIVEASFANRFDVCKILALLIESEAMAEVAVPELRREAEKSVAAGDTESAVKYLSRLVAVKGDTPEMHQQLAEALESERELERASFHYRVFAEIQADAGTVKPAFETYRRIVELLPTDLAAADRMIEIFSINPDGLEEYAREVIERGKELAEIYVELRRSSRAIQVLHRVVSLGPDDPDLRSRLIDVYLATGMTGEAVAEYEALAETALAVRDFAGAEVIYRKMLSIDRTRDDVLARLNQLISRKTQRRRSVRNSLVACAAVALIGVGAWYAMQFWISFRAQTERNDASAQSLLSDTQTRHAVADQALGAANSALASKLGEVDQLIEAYENHADGRAEVKRLVNDAIQAYMAIVEQHPGTPGAAQALETTESLNEGLAHLGKTEGDALLIMAKRAQTLYAEGEGLVNAAAPTRQQWEKFGAAVRLAAHCTEWLASPEGQDCQGYESSLRESIESFDSTSIQVRELVASGDAKTAFDRAMDFMCSFPPPDLAAEFAVPIVIRSEPTGARIVVDGVDTGLYADAPVFISLRAGARIDLELDGFERTGVTIEPNDEYDPKVLRDSVRRAHVVPMQKALAFRSAPLGARIEAPALLHDSTAIVPTRATRTEIIDVSSGALTAPLPTRNPNGVVTAPILHGRIVALAAIDNLVYFYDLPDRRYLGKYEASGELRADPILDGGRLILADGDGHVTAVDMATRRELWRYPARGRPRLSRGFEASPTLVNGELYAPTTDGSIHVIDSANGQLLRELRVRSGDEPVSLRSRVAIDGDSLYAASRNGRVFRINRHSGKLDWAVPAGIEPVAGPLVSDGVLYVVGRKGRVQGIGLADGAATTAYDLDKRITAEPTLADGALLIGDASGRLTALDVTGHGLERRWQFTVPAGPDGDPVAITSRPVVQGTLILFGAADKCLRGVVR